MKQAMPDLIAPELESLRGEVEALRSEVHGEMTAHIARLDERLAIALDVRERVVALEAGAGRWSPRAAAVLTGRARTENS